jgi:SH3-like domain-containing protein
MSLRLLGLAGVFCLGTALGAEFRSVGVNGAILYDGPSFKATRIYLVSKQYPLEIISRSGEWIKVRDANGDLSWIAANTLSDKRTVLITSVVADIREAPQESSPAVFRAEKNVVLELVEPPSSTWIKVRHRDGQSGYIKLDQIWGL